jgi:DNA-directed RNA polymerase subunit L
MELKIIEQEKNKLVLEIEGEDHTFCNVLKDELWNDEHVKLASYNIKHPVVSSPYVIVETDGSITPQQALANAAKRVGKAAEKFKTEFAKSVK